MQVANTETETRTSAQTRPSPSATTTQTRAAKPAANSDPATKVRPTSGGFQGLGSVCRNCQSEHTCTPLLANYPFIGVCVAVVSTFSHLVMLFFCADCPFGDRAGWCEDVIASDPSECYRDSTTCCATCKKHRTAVQGARFLVFSWGINWCDRLTD